MKKKYSLVMAAISIGMPSVFGIASDTGAKNQSEQLAKPAPKVDIIEIRVLNIF